MPQEDVLAVRVDHISRPIWRSIICYLHNEEDVRNVILRRGRVAIVRYRLQPETRRSANADLTTASADINGASCLVHVYIAGLPNQPCGVGHAIRQAAIGRALNLTDGWRDCPIEEIHIIVVIEFEPLTVIDRSAPRNVT